MKRLACAVVGVTLIAPARIALYALMLKRARRTHPELFDGQRASESIAICMEDYVREIEAGAYRRPWNDSPWLN